MLTREQPSSPVLSEPIAPQEGLAARSREETDASGVFSTGGTP
jgi:hypothetical protein